MKETNKDFDCDYQKKDNKYISFYKSVFLIEMFISPEKPFMFYVQEFPKQNFNYEPSN